MTAKPAKQPRGHAWRKGPACQGKRALASWNAYRKNAPKVKPHTTPGSGH